VNGCIGRIKAGVEGAGFANSRLNVPETGNEFRRNFNRIDPRIIEGGMAFGSLYGTIH
jgi:hypothetical protein